MKTNNIFDEFVSFLDEEEKKKPKFIKKNELENLREIFKPVKPTTYSEIIKIGSAYRWGTSVLSSKTFQSSNSFEVCRSVALVGHPFLTTNNNPDYSKELIKDIVKEKDNLRFVVLESYDIKDSIVAKIFCGNKIHWTVLSVQLLEYEIKKLD